MGHVDVSYHVIATSSADEAESLAGYLTEHGLTAFAQPGNEVNIPLEEDSDEAYATIRTLKKTWRLFFDNTEQGLLDLPLYVKHTPCP